MPKGAQPNNTNALKGEAKRLPWHGLLDPKTLDGIKQIAISYRCSQSQTIDMIYQDWRKPLSQAIEFLLDLTSEQKRLCEERDIDWLFVADQIDEIAAVLNGPKGE